MPNEDLSRRHFQKRISSYCDVRIAPVVPVWVLDNVRRYLLGLISFRKKPALAGSRYDWQQIAHDCGIDEALTTTLKKQLRPALDAFMRWLKEPPLEDDSPKGKGPRAALRASAVRKSISSPMSQRHEAGRVETSPSASRLGPKPKPISEIPEPVFEANEEPNSFADVLA